MKKILAIILIIIFAFSLIACSNGNDNHTTTSNSITPNTQLEEEEIDYTPYANLVNEYFEKYGELVEEQIYQSNGINTAGFNYANLIDLNNDGILELVLAGVSDETNSLKNVSRAIDLYFGYDSLKKLVSIYTLSDSGEALLLGEQTFSSYGNGGVEFGIEYAETNKKTYILNSFRGDNEKVTYYELLNSELIENLSYEKNYDYENDEYSTTLNGAECETTTLEDVLKTKGEVELHKISWLTQEELKQLITRNEETFSFLEQYAPINRTLEKTEDVKPFEVSFVAYYQEIIDSYGYEIPVFDKVLTSEEQDRLEYFGTEYGDQYYLIKGAWQTPIKIYKTSIDKYYNPVREELIYETNSNILYLLCNESELHSEVEIVITSPDGEEFSYYPLVSGFDGSAELGENGREFDFIGNVMQDVDYSPYSALLKAYTLDYNVTYTDYDDYEVTGMTLTPSAYDPDESIKDARGFCYADLIDLDNNGVLELILVAYDTQEYDNYEKYYEEWEIRIEDLKYPNIVKIYTILPNYGLEFVGSLPLDIISQTPDNPLAPTIIHYGIDYSVSDNKTYILLSETNKEDGEQYRYYGLTDGLFGVEAFFEVEFKDDFIYYFEGEEYSQEEFFEIKNSYGESEHQYITKINDKYVEKLERINKVTFDFLENYPVKNFDNFSGTYNNGQFYFEEFPLLDYYPPFEPIMSYYKAITMRDYDTLEQLIGYEKADFFKYCHINETPYVPGYIISDLQGDIAFEDIEHEELREIVTDLKNEAQREDNQVYVVKCIVNEVLDPHVVEFGLQVSGGMYETYFIVSTTDPIDGQWVIEAIIDDKWYK